MPFISLDYSGTPSIHWTQDQAVFASDPMKDIKHFWIYNQALDYIMEFESKQIVNAVISPETVTIKIDDEKYIIPYSGRSISKGFNILMNSVPRGILNVTIVGYQLPPNSNKSMIKLKNRGGNVSLKARKNQGVSKRVEKSGGMGSR